MRSDCHRINLGPQPGNIKWSCRYLTAVFAYCSVRRLFQIEYQAGAGEDTEPGIGSGAVGTIDNDPKIDFAGLALMPQVFFRPRCPDRIPLLASVAMTLSMPPI